MEINVEIPASRVPEKITINNCNYNLLPAEFYEREDNDICSLEQNLLKMEEQAKRVSSPIIYGEFIDEAHYLNSIEILLLSTAETRNREIFLQKIVSPRIKAKNKFLEIGPGDGGLVKKVGADFGSITIVDNNEKILKLMQSTFSKKTKMIQCDFVDFYPEKACYDLILMSHILYYFDHNLWEELIIRAYRALTPGGALVIIISNDLEKSKIESFFGGCSLPIEKTILNCDSILGSVSEKYASVESFMSRDRVSMQHIANILLNDAKCKADERSVIDYLDRLCKKDSRYSISTYREGSLNCVSPIKARFLTFLQSKYQAEKSLVPSYASVGSISF